MTSRITGSRRRISTTALVVVGLAVAVALVVFVAPFASRAPDGLEKVSADTGIDAGVTEHHLADSPFVSLPTGVAGVAGVAVTFVVGAGALWLVRRRRDRARPVRGLMGGSHRHLLVHEEGPLHRLAPQCKLAATVLFVFAVVATPKEQLWAFGIEAALVVVAAVIGGVPLLGLVRRLVIEVPFLLFAVLLPIVGRSPRVDVLGVSLSEPGLWAAWNIVAKGTIGVAATVVLASTTSIPHILDGLERLHVPRTMVAITAFMLRYGDVIGDELRRMRVARESCGASASRLGHARAVATSAGTLFVRSYERGERVYLAMASRGYTGSMPVRTAPSTAGVWAVCLLWPALAAAVAVVAWTVQA